MSSPSSPPLIPRAKLFGNPSRAMCLISPDGRWLSWLAPKDGVLNIWISPLGDIAAARVVTQDKKRGIRMYGWAYNSTHLLFLQDEGGTEDWHVYVVELASGSARDLTPMAGVQAQLHDLSLDHPNLVAVGLNNRDKAWHDLYCIDMLSGEQELIFENKQQLGQVVLDRQLRPRLASQPRGKEGGRTLYRIEGSTLEPIGVVEHEDELTTHTLGFTRDGATLYGLSSIGRDRAALIATDWRTGRERVLAEHPKADIGRVLNNPQTYVIDAVGVRYLRLDWMALDARVGADLQRLQAALPGEIAVADRTLDDSRWIVFASAADAPAAYHLFERSSGTIRELFVTRPDLQPYRLAPMRGEVIRARDGLQLTAYVTLPVAAGERPQTPLAMVLLVHGGPWARDEYGFNPQHQWLADRGFAVLSVNFRGSTGFGKAFVNAGDHEWGRKMHEDLIDAVEWAIAQGLAQGDRVAIFGASYGGYAALAGLTFTPQLFCCGVDIVGPSDLATLLATTPPYWAAFFESLARRVGDPRTEEGRALLRQRSPLYFAHAIAKPLLIGQGANDPRVKQAESDQIIAAMRAKGLAVTYVLYPEEGHGFAIPENRQAFYAVAEAFLVTHLGGIAQPIGADFEGAKFEVPEGKHHIPGLNAALG